MAVTRQVPVAICTSSHLVSCSRPLLLHVEKIMKRMLLVGVFTCLSER